MNEKKNDRAGLGFALTWGALILLLFTCLKLFGAPLSYEKQNKITDEQPLVASNVKSVNGIKRHSYVNPSTQPRQDDPLKEEHTSVENNAYVDPTVTEAGKLSSNADGSALKIYTDEDLKWLAAIINAEARGEPFEGMLAVGTVVLNRTESCLFPDTVKDVIFDCRYGIQFSPVADGSIELPPTNESISAAILCLQGFRTDPDILFFYNPSLSDSTYFREYRTYEFRIGNHEFYS